MPDVIVIGGGVIGLTAAYELAGRGLHVTVLDQQQPGTEASWAGAGILPPSHPGPASNPLAQLASSSHALWPQLTEQLRAQTGIDNGFRRCGGICFAPDADHEALQGEIVDWRAAGVAAEPLTGEQLLSHEPHLGSDIGPAYRLGDTWQVRNPRHLKALVVACTQRGVRIEQGERVIGIETVQERVKAVQTILKRHEADHFLLTAGAWSRQLLEKMGCRRIVEPVRGQILMLSNPAPLFSHVIECGPRYLVPRSEGLVLVGSTEEWVGYEKRNTPREMDDLLRFAIRMVPRLADATFERAWSGLRPHSIDGRPIIGRLAGLENLVVATGHFRAGLHLSPITARLVTQVLMQESTELNLAEFSPSASAADD